MTFTHEALTWHVTSNMYPRWHPEIVPVLMRACANAERGEWDRRVRVPSGMMLKTRKLLEMANLAQEFAGPDMAEKSGD